MATATTKKKPVTVADQQVAEAARIAGLAIDPAKADIAKAVAAAEDRRLALARAGEGITKALGDMSAGDAEEQRAAYADAATRIGGLGTALTGRLRELQAAPAAAATERIRGLGLSGAVPPPSESNANTVGLLGAVIPGETLAAQAPRALDAAQARRLAGGLRVADNASLADLKAGEGVNEIRAQIAKLEAKRPGLVLEALDHIRQQANAKRATDTQIGYLQLQQAKTVQDQAVAMTNLTGTIHVVVGKGKAAHVVDTGKPASGSDAAIAQVRAETSSTNAATAAAARTEAARIAAAAKKEAARIAAEAKRDAAEVKKAEAANKPIPPATVSSVTARARNQGVKTLDTLLSKIWANIPEAAAKKSGESTKDYNDRQAIAQAKYQKRLTMNWGTAMAQVINAISPHLRVLKYTPQQIKQVASQIVSAEITAPTGG